MNGGDSIQQQKMQQQQYQQQWAAMQQYQQQWAAMQYPDMVMQQRMMYNVHYVPYYHGNHMQQQYQQPLQPQTQPVKNNHQIQSSGDDNKTIWIGDLQRWMDEDYLLSCFSQTGEVSLSLMSQGDLAADLDGLVAHTTRGPCAFSSAFTIYVS